MNALSASELLDIWELGGAQLPPLRAITLLAAACPEVDLDSLMRLKVGQRDALLISLRELIFGPKIICLAECPSCSEKLELTFNSGDIRVISEDDQLEPLSFTESKYEVKFRIPDSLDLIAISNCRNDSARHLLLDRCLLAISHEGKKITADQLPSKILDALLEYMDESDPQGDILINLSCPSCAHNWQDIFDILSFFWIEIDAWARSVLLEVQALASAYGWSEKDILAMSSQRRRLYLELLVE